MANLDERTRRIMAANEAMSLGYGGVSLVRRACGLSRKAIAKGIREIRQRAGPKAVFVAPERDENPSRCRIRAW